MLSRKPKGPSVVAIGHGGRRHRSYREQRKQSCLECHDVMPQCWQISAAREKFSRQPARLSKIGRYWTVMLCVMVEHPVPPPLRPHTRMV